MMASPFYLFIRGLFVLLSFIGLCALIRVCFGADVLIAPAVAVGGVISILMFAGIIGLLRFALYALYILGFVGIAYAYFIRTSPPPRLLLLILVLFVGYLIFRFYAITITNIDDFNQWGLVARFLVRHDRFPNHVDNFINFQSYPLGTACFIYFVSNPIGEIDGVYFIAHNIMPALLFLPMFALIRKQKRVFYPTVIVTFLLLFARCCRTNALTVDIHLSFMGISMIAIIAYYRNDFDRALLFTIPLMITTVYTKNSGMYFSLCVALMLIYLARRNGRYSRRLAIALVALPFVVYLIWAISMKLRFPGALQSKHAISPIVYFRHLRQKGLRGILLIAKAMLIAFFRPDKEKITFLILLCVFILYHFIAYIGMPPETHKQYLYASAFAVGCYLLWFLLIYFMYLFSMPTGEALKIASFSRYDITGFLFMVGMFAVSAFCSYREEQSLTSVQENAASFISFFCLVALLLLSLFPSEYAQISTLYKPTLNPIRLELRKQCQQMRETYHLPDGGRYIVFSDSNFEAHFIFRYIEYEFETGEIYQFRVDSENADQFLGGYKENLKQIDDVQAVLPKLMDSADALIIINGTQEFKTEMDLFLQSYAGDTPVCRIDI